MNIIILIVLVLLSAFFSASETAFVMVNKLKIEIKARKNDLSAKYILYFFKHPETFYSTILLSNTVVNLTFASMSTILLYQNFHLEEIAIVAISTSIILLFGEIVPKSISRENADVICMLSIIPIRWLSKILFPITKITSYIAQILTGSKKLKEEAYMRSFDTEDIKELITESEKEGGVTRKESILIGKVLQLKDQQVYEAMRPRIEVIGIEMSASIAEAMSVFIESGFSVLPVYDDNLDHIKGIIKAHDLFTNPASIGQIMREVPFVPEARKSTDMLNDFLNQKVSFAVVVDEFGGTAGIVTMEDIMEELFGEIKDEYDIEENICRKIDDTTFIISGKIEIDYINEHYGLKIPVGEYETISGFITAHIGRIPDKNEEIKIHQFQFNIVRATNVKIELVKLLIKKD
jgi:putative hemolysin